MKVVITGSRSWTDYRTIRRRLQRLPGDTLIIHGAARGADSLAQKAAEYHMLRTEVYPADWERYGKRAGYIRNAFMLDQKPDLVLAFWDGESKGTLHTMKEAQRRGIPVEVIRDPGDPA